MPESPDNPSAEAAGAAEAAPTPPVPATSTTAVPDPTATAGDIAAKVQAAHDAVGEAHQALQDAVKSVDEIAADAQAAAGPLPGADIEAPPLQVEKAPKPPELRRLLALEVPVIVQLGTRQMSVGEVMRFSVGSIIEFQKSADEDLELLANNKPIGKGQAVKVGENFGIKLTAVGSVKDTIRKLGTA